MFLLCASTMLGIGSIKEGDILRAFPALKDLTVEGPYRCDHLQSSVHSVKILIGSSMKEYQAGLSNPVLESQGKTPREKGC